MTEVEMYRPRAELAVPPANDTDSWITVVRDIIKFAEVIYDTPFVPDGLRGSAPAVAAAMLAGREMGLGVMTSLANIDVIRGKPTQKPLLMRAMIQARGHTWEDVETTDTRAVVRGRRKGESGWTTVAFTADQARKAGLDLGKYPADKLYARATSRLARHQFADVIMGMPYSSDEVEDGLDVEIGVDTATGEIARAKQDGAAAAIEAAKPKTAQRRPRDPKAAPAATTTPATTTPAAPADSDLPPLPGEDEPDPTPARTAGTSDASTASTGKADDTDYDTPGTVNGPMITAIWTVLNKEFQFGSDEKDQARMVCAQIIRRDLDSTKNLSRNEAKAILDTLGHWKAQAAAKQEDTRAYLIEMLTLLETGEVPGE